MTETLLHAWFDLFSSIEYPYWLFDFIDSLRAWTTWKSRDSKEKSFCFPSSHVNKSCHCAKNISCRIPQYNLYCFVELHDDFSTKKPPNMSNSTVEALKSVTFNFPFEWKSLKQKWCCLREEKASPRRNHNSFHVKWLSSAGARGEDKSQHSESSFYSVLLFFLSVEKKYPITMNKFFFTFTTSKMDEKAHQQSGVKVDLQVLNLFDPPRTRLLTFNNIIIVHNSPLTIPHIRRAFVLLLIPKRLI